MKSIKLYLLITTILIANAGFSQLEIIKQHSPDYLVRNVLVGKNSGLTIDEVTYTGAPLSIGLFTTDFLYNDIIKKGIILSTGSVFDAKGTNGNTMTGTDMQYRGDPDVSLIAESVTMDAAILEFDFIPTTDSISFNFFFASEEYPEYVNKGVNDVFGFFLSSEELDYKVNLAVLEGTETPITVDHINRETNSEFYIENKYWNSNNISQWENNKPQGELAYAMQYDGFTVLLKAGAQVIPNKKYHLKMVIADVGDRVYDSAVFIEAGSFVSVSNTEITLDEQLATAFDKDIDEISNSVNLNIEFQFNSFKISGETSYDLLDKVYEILINNENTTLEILGHTDNVGSVKYNKELSLNRAKEVATYLKSKGVDKSRVTYSGLGASNPLSDEDSDEGRALNRRVEFVFE